MKTAKGLFSVLYFFRACENTERIVSITTLMNQCSSSNHATKHFFYFYLQYFFSFPVDPFPFSLSSHNFRFLVLLLHLFQIGIRLLHAKIIPFLSLYLPNFKFLFFWNHILGAHQSEIHIYQADLQVFHICSNFVTFFFFNYTRILRNTSSVSIETHVRNNTKSIF